MAGPELLSSCQIVYLSIGLYEQVPENLSPVKDFSKVSGYYLFMSDAYSQILPPFS